MTDEEFAADVRDTINHLNDLLKKAWSDHRAVVYIHEDSSSQGHTNKLELMQIKKDLMG